MPIPDVAGFAPFEPPPLVALTLGDVAGIGPEVIARAWPDPRLHGSSRPFVVGNGAILRRAIACAGSTAQVQPIHHPEEADPSLHRLPCLDVMTAGLDGVAPGRVDSRAGRAAHDFLNAAIDLALAGRVDAIVTLPLNKEALRQAGIAHPGHTEILAERCRARDFSMMLYLDPDASPHGHGLGVVHATLHVPLRRVFELLTVRRVHDTIALADRALRPLTGGRAPRLAVAGLNPHAGENGLFGDEERTIIGPAVEQAIAEGLEVAGPIPADTLFARALGGEFDAVVAMYHDQGHVALKTIGFDRATNVTLGLPIVRTSVAHGTAFDIAWQGRAETTSLIQAVRVAARIVAGRRALTTGRPGPRPTPS
jgi:4-hydroxythreonine-4-phosphate dehydrogenase